MKKKKEIRETLYDPRNNFFQPEKDHYKPVKNGNVFSSNFFEYKNNGQKDKTLSIKDDLDEIKSQLSEWRIHTQGEWKIHLTITINFFSEETEESEDSEETCTMYSNSDNIEVMLGRETDKIIEDLFDSLLERHQQNLEE